MGIGVFLSTGGLRATPTSDDEDRPLNRPCSLPSVFPARIVNRSQAATSNFALLTSMNCSIAADAFTRYFSSHALEILRQLAVRRGDRSHFPATTVAGEFGKSLEKPVL